MRDPSFIRGEPLLGEAVPCSAHSRRQFLTRLFSLISVGVAVVLCARSMRLQHLEGLEAPITLATLAFAKGPVLTPKALSRFQPRTSVSKQLQTLPLASKRFESLPQRLPVAVSAQASKPGESAVDETTADEAAAGVGGADDSNALKRELEKRLADEKSDTDEKAADETDDAPPDVDQKLYSDMDDSPMTGKELQELVMSRWGYLYDTRITRRSDAFAVEKYYLQVMWKFLGGRGFHMNVQQYDDQLDAVADLLTEFGCAKQIRWDIPRWTKKPYEGFASGTAVMIPLDIEFEEEK